MDTPIQFPDPRLAVRDLLRSLLAARNEPSAAGATVSTRNAPGRDEAPSLPWVQVKSDGRTRDARLNGQATIRVLVYHTDDGRGEDLAALCEALLLAAKSPQIRGFSPSVGPTPTGDPDTGDPMSFFILTARLRPSQLTY